jgi:hypothetical protein
MRRALGMVAIALVSVAASGCGPGRIRVMVPPQIDLKIHEVIGVIDFRCSSEDELGPYAHSGSSTPPGRTRAWCGS